MDPDTTSPRSSVGREKPVSAVPEDKGKDSITSVPTNKKSRSRIQPSSSRGSPATSPPATLQSVDPAAIASAVTERKGTQTQRFMERLVRQESKNLVLSLDLEMDRPLTNSRVIDIVIKMLGCWLMLDVQSSNGGKPNIPPSASTDIGRTDKKRFDSPGSFVFSCQMRIKFSSITSTCSLAIPKYRNLSFFCRSRV